MEKDKSCMVHLYMEPNKTELKETENKLVVTRGKGWAVAQMGEGGQKVQTSSFK